MSKKLWIYAYSLSLTTHLNMIKVGMTDRPDPEKRIKEQTVTAGTFRYANLLFFEQAIRADGSTFSDHDVHNLLKSAGVRNVVGEWFECDVETLRKAFLSLKRGIDFSYGRTLDFTLRPEQKNAIEKTLGYFSKSKGDRSFLWNAKMRFGKTFTTYKLCEKAVFKRILVVTFMPAVSSSWQEDLDKHVDFYEWKFFDCLMNKFDPKEVIARMKPYVVFISFQNLLGKDTNGNSKEKNNWIFSHEWDFVAFDEYHFGAWREKAKGLFDLKNDNDELILDDDEISSITKKIKASYKLFLSGTPFRAMVNGEFIEEQVYNWTYIDEQLAKRSMQNVPGNPYEQLPTLKVYLYELSGSLSQNAPDSDQFDGFSLNKLFEAEHNEEGLANFLRPELIRGWLNLISGKVRPNPRITNAKLSASPPLPFLDSKLREVLRHTFWFLPNIAACQAMEKELLAHPYFKNYKIINVAGKSCGNGRKAFEYLINKVQNPLSDWTITLSCGKLTTGVTVKFWGGVLMLRDLESPETYFQTIFRAQNPWIVKDGLTTKILKKECVVLDFSPHRTLSLLVTYVDSLASLEDNLDQKSLSEKMVTLTSVLPIFGYLDGVWKELDASDIFDLSSYGISGTLLARKWNSSNLINLDSKTLGILLGDEKALSILAKIPNFRNPREYIEKIVSANSEIEKIISEKMVNGDSENDRKLSEVKKKRNNKRKEVLTMILKFVTRIPIFMYLSNFRELSVSDLIRARETPLFELTTGLALSDFEHLRSIGLFNKSQMDDAVLKFKSYEDPSLEYLSQTTYRPKRIGAFDTTISAESFGKVYKTKVR